MLWVETRSVHPSVVLAFARTTSSIWHARCRIKKMPGTGPGIRVLSIFAV